METLDGLDATFFALESETVHLHVGTVLVLDPPEGRRSLFSPETRFDQIRAMVESRLYSSYCCGLVTRTLART